MFLNIIVTVLRETLEAGVLISLLLSVGHSHNFSAFWIVPSITVGVFGAFFYAINLGYISDWAGYVGQELFNASLHFSIFIVLALIISVLEKPLLIKTQTLKIFLSIVAALAFVREGGELFVFYSGYIQNSNILLGAIASGVIGLSIGASVGALFYYLITTMPAHYSAKLRMLMFYFLSAGMALQGAKLLIQADWLPSYQPLWDTNQWLPENSFVGQLVYAVFAYEATPSIIEVTFYVCAVCIIFSLRFRNKVYVHSEE